MAAEGSVSPRERVNIVYKPATGGLSAEKELPLKLVMMGDYTLREDDRPLEDREPINVNKENFNEVMESQDLSLSFGVAELGPEMDTGTLFENADKAMYMAKAKAKDKIHVYGE